MGEHMKHFVAALAALLVAASAYAATPVRYLSAASTNATVVKATPGAVYTISAINTTATLYYLKFFDSASNPTCAGTPVQTLPVPASATGAGLILPIAVGMDFNIGISFCLTGAIADNDVTVAVTGVAISLTYK